MTFEAGGQPLGRVVFELFNDRVPKTAENFRVLATGEKGISELSRVPLYYKRSVIHRSIKDFMIQGGDFTKMNGQGGESIYGSPFEDEDLSGSVDKEGLLVMANRGPNTNGSQFFVTVKPCPHLNGKHVVFGRVVSGFDVILQISEMQVDEKARPLVPVVIEHCGELVLQKPAAKAKAPVTSGSNAGSDSSSEDERPHKKKSKHSRTEDGGKERKSKKHKHRHHDPASRSPTPTAKEPQQETEEEYDARLEREEEERIAEAKRVELARLKERLERDKKRDVVVDEKGVRYKGRGRMMFKDPEMEI